MQSVYATLGQLMHQWPNEKIYVRRGRLATFVLIKMRLDGKYVYYRYFADRKYPYAGESVLVLMQINPLTISLSERRILRDYFIKDWPSAKHLVELWLGNETDAFEMFITSLTNNVEKSN